MGEGSELKAAPRPLPRALRGTGTPPESAEQLRAQGVRTMRRERRAVSLLRRPCQHEARRCPHGRGAQGSLACPPPPSLRTHRTHSLLRSLPRPPPPPTLHRAPCTLHPAPANPSRGARPHTCIRGQSALERGPRGSCDAVCDALSMRAPH